MRGTIARWISPSLLVTIGLLGCGPRARVWRPEPDAAGPALRLIDSVVIAEPDSAQMGQYTSFFARAGDGRLFVADITKHMVFQFAANGVFERLIGRSGQGPGELELPSSVVVLPGDSIVGVFDVNKRGLSLFSIMSGRYLRQVRFPAQDVGAPWGFEGDTAYLPLHMGQSLLGVWSMKDSTVTDHFPIPVALASNPGLVMRHGRPGVAIADSGLAFLLPTEPGVLITTRLGVPTELVRLPAARRRGEPSNLAELERGKGRGSPPPPFAGSLADGIHRLPSGDLLVVHLDLDLAPSTGGPMQFVAPRLYVSVLRRDLAAACVDGELPVESDVPPMPVFSGDTMFVLSRRVEGSSVRSTLLKYVIDSRLCTWISTSRDPTSVTKHD